MLGWTLFLKLRKMSLTKRILKSFFYYALNTLSNVNEQIDFCRDMVYEYLEIIFSIW